MAAERGKGHLHVPTSEERPDGIEFLAHRGFRELERYKIVRLDLAGLAVPSSSAPDGVSLTTLAERPDLVEGVHAVANATFADIPSADEPITVGDLAEFRARDVDQLPGWGFIVAIEDATGEAVGYASLYERPDGAAVYWHDMTAVVPRWRGRGLATALKAETIRAAIAHGAVALETGNDTANAPMRAVNARLGYRPLPDSITMRGAVTPPPAPRPRRRPIRARRSAALEVRQHLASRVAARHAGDAAARVRARAGQVEAVERHPIARPPEERTPGEERVERGLRVERVTARQPVVAFEVGRGEDLPRHDAGGDAGRDRLERAQHGVAEGLPLVVPGRRRAACRGPTGRARSGPACPGAASATREGSASDGMVASTASASAMPPYFVGSKTRSSASMPVIPTRIRPRRSRGSSAAAGKAGRPSSTRLTLATRPGVRMFDARQRSDGPTATGSTRVVSSRFGSTLATIARAAISSPDARAMPVAGPSEAVTATTSAPVRISPPAARAAEARASTRAPGPPAAKTVSPDAPPSLPAASSRSTLVVPADHGPIAVWRTPRQATVARSGSAESDSPTKSATAIASTRRIVRPSSRPRPLNARPTRRPMSASPARGAPTSGGVSSPRSARNRASRRTSRSRSTNAFASAVDQAWSEAHVAATSRQRATCRPSGCGAKARTSGAMSRSPWRAQVELAGDGRPEPPDRVGDDRDVGARCELRGVDGPAEPVAALDDEDASARPARDTPPRSARCGHRRAR